MGARERRLVSITGSSKRPKARTPEGWGCHDAQAALRAAAAPRSRLCAPARLGRFRRRVPLSARHAAPSGGGQGVAVGRARSRPAAHVQRRGRRARAPLGAPRDRHGLSGRHLGRRPAVHRHGVLPGIARAALPHRTDACRRGHGHRRAPRGRPRIGAPGGAHPPRHQAQQHPHHDIRLGGARRLRHLVDARALRRRRGARHVDPVERARGGRRADRRHRVERGVEPRGHRVFAAGRAQPVRAPRAGAEHPRPHAPAHRAGHLRADRARRRARRPAAGARDRDGPRPRAPVPHGGRVRRGGARGAARRATRRDPARGARSGVDAGGGDRRFRRHHRARAGAQPGRARGPSRVGGA